MRRFGATSALGALVLLGACDKPPQPVAQPVRPVLSMVVAQSPVNALELAGTVQPRVQTAFAFRVLGRLTARAVNVGDLVVKGQVLGAIDPVSLELNVRADAAVLANSHAQLINAAGVEERQKELLKTGSTTQALYDSAEQSLTSAQAGVTSAQAALDKAKEQLGYAVLKSDFAGVVTAVGAEVGQVVSPGEMIANVADPALRDAVIDVPDALIPLLKPDAQFEVALEIDPTIEASGAIREMAPEADAATRTRRVKIALDNPPDGFRLGVTITAKLRSGAAVLLLPVSAILEKDGRDQVWIVDPKSLTVSLHDVKTARNGDDFVEIESGLDPATRVVTAGVHSLVEGQRVKIDEEVAP
jgi:membrane fusion protein, multidrug efflux system